MNPCPCGYRGDPRRQCTCLPPELQRYRSRISGPLLDRIDLQVEVPAVPFRDLSGDASEEPSSEVRERVERARETQLRRLRGRKIVCNAQLTTRDLRRHCAVDAAGERLLEDAVERLGLSARAHHRVLKVSRTIADLSGSGRIEAAHLAEAIQYRALDRSDGP
jgi:magnesium chelatase family protein